MKTLYLNLALSFDETVDYQLCMQNSKAVNVVYSFSFSSSRSRDLGWLSGFAPSAVRIWEVTGTMLL